MARKTAFMAAALSAVALTLTACGGGGSETDATTLRRSIGASPKSVDPHKAEGTWENDVIGDMFIGLFTEDVEGNPIPGMAESWTTSDDGLVWTFKLRDANWSDGQPVTARDFQFGMRRILDPKSTGSAYGSLLYVLKNAQKVNSGELPVEELGVKIIDDKTLEVTLEYPAPYLPGLLKHYVSFPVPAHVVSELGSGWVKPENIVVNGAYKLDEWRTGDFLRSVKNPGFYDAENVCFNEIVYFPYSDHGAVVRMAQTGKLDMANAFPNERYEELKESLPGWPRVFSMMTTTYVSLNNQQAPFDDKRVRQALSMAIDREYITEKVMGAGQTPVYGLVPKGMRNYPEGAQITWKGLSRADRLVEAKRLLEEAGFGPDNPLKFEYIYRSTGENPKAAPVIQANWLEIADWVQPEIRRVDTQVLYKQLQQGDFEASDAAWVADYNDAFNFLYLFDSRSGPMNYGNYSNPEFDALIDKSHLQLDPVARAKTLRAAEQVLMDDSAMIPMWTPGRQYLVNPDITGFEPNVEDIHRSRYMCRKSLKEG
ncbi:MAG: peptide ABC transporter substrate-binding protein [Hirschia sp.]|nr:peptide ABC transporter substrate-binding protein [Hirschia sp.]MBF18212.1 peptide ABC transporter substrate-binding protein [Hirschia sp.]